MNYYPFHIGDYASATRHLSWDEDCAYRRLLDVYYTTEKPLPLDIKRVCRLAVASSKVQRDAVAAVLEEFFEKTDAGWINARADEEIDAMRIKQAAGEEKAAHEAGRMSRYRERRAAMFQALRAVDVVPAWDISMKELQRLHDQHCNATGGDTATSLQREQAVSGDATATAVPTPTPTPTPIIKEAEASLSPGKPDAIPHCPHGELLDLFAEHLPMLPQPKPELWTGARAAALKARWRWVLTAKKRDGSRYASNHEEALSWFRRFFAYVAESDFLTGRDGKWTACDLGWLCNESNFAKVLQGNYDCREVA